MEYIVTLHSTVSHYSSKCTMVTICDERTTSLLKTQSVTRYGLVGHDTTQVHVCRHTHTNILPPFCMYKVVQI